MKKIRAFLGVLAFMFAFASAFAFKSASTAEDPAYISSQNQCERVEATCAGTLNNCVINGVEIRQFQQGTSCGAVLKMGN